MSAEIKRAHAHKEVLTHLADCRDGKSAEDFNGFNLMFMVNHFIGNGGSFDQLGLIWDEVHYYLVEDLKHSIDRLEAGERWDYDYMTAFDIEWYLLEDGSALLGPKLVSEIGMTQERMERIYEHVCGSPVKNS